MDFGPSDHVVEPGTRVELFPDIPAVAIIDALASDNAMFRALLARRNPVLEEYLAEQRREARLTTTRDILCLILENRKILIDESQRARIQACDDLDTLDGWLRRAPKIDGAAALLD